MAWFEIAQCENTSHPQAKGIAGDASGCAPRIRPIMMGPCEPNTICSCVHRTNVLLRTVFVIPTLCSGQKAHVYLAAALRPTALATSAETGCPPVGCIRGCGWRAKDQVDIFGAVSLAAVSASCRPDDIPWNHFRHRAAKSSMRASIPTSLRCADSEVAALIISRARRVCDV